MKYSICFLLILGAFVSKGQDVYQTQYFNNPMVINSAYTGVMDDQYRVGFNFRSQWFNPLNSDDFRTGTFNAEMKSHISGNDFYGLGLVVGSDQSGDAQFQQTFVHGSASYIKQISSSGDDDIYLIGGMKFGGIQYRLSPERRWFGSQFSFSTLNLDRTLPNNESPQFIDNFDTGLIPDIGVGLSAYLSSKKYSVYGGIAVDHVTRPKLDLGTGRDNLDMKWSINAGYNLKTTKYSEILTAALWVSQGDQRMLLPSFQYRVTTQDDDDIAFRLGLLNKVVSGTDFIVFESWSALAMLEYHQFVLGLSYDITSSKLSNYNNANGGFELSMNYRFAKVKRHQPINCPKF